MKLFILIYALIIGFYTSTVRDFIFCVIPLLLLFNRPRIVDVFIFTRDDTEIAELFVDTVLDADSDYDKARVMLVNTDRLRDELEQGD